MLAFLLSNNDLEDTTIATDTLPTAAAALQAKFDDNNGKLVII
jgi:hypothetical protein